MLTITHNARVYVDMSPATLTEKGVPTQVINAALKADAVRKIAEFAENYRARLATRSAGKLAEYRIKEEIARDPSAASQVELDLLSREAKARGTNRTGLITQISAEAVAYRQIALLVGALEAEASAAIDAVPDDAANVEDLIVTVLITAREQADAAYSDALTILKGAK